MDQTVTYILEDLLDPEQSQTYTGTVKVANPARGGIGRVQKVTARGDGVKATPYEASFDNGLVLLSKKDARGTVEDDDRFSGGRLWQKRKYHVSICPSKAVMPIPLGITPLPADQSAMDEATTQALADARRGMVSVPMLLKELPSSLRMVGSRAGQALNAGTSLVKYWDTLVRNARGNRLKRKLLVDANASYLEFLFGWKPFVEETYALMDAINKEKSMKIVGRGRARRVDAVALAPVITEQGNFRVNNELGYQDVYLRGTHARISLIEYEHKVRASVVYEARSAWGANVARYGINWRDAAFDAIPLSFLLNFSTNVQDFLTASSPMVDADYVTGHVTTYSFGKVKHTVTSNLHVLSTITPNKAFPLDEAGEYKFLEERAAVQRKVLYSEPEPSLLMRSLFDAKRAASLASILVVTQHNNFAKAMARFGKQL